MIGARPIWLFLLYGVLLTGLLALAMPPFQNADETNHALRADQVSRLGLLGTRFAGGRDSGGLASPGIVAASHEFDAIRSAPDARLTSHMLAASAGIPWGAPVMTGFANTAIYPPLFYAPAAAALRFGRARGWTVVRTLRLARSATAVVSLALAAAAIGIAGRARPLLFAILCLPMSAALMASVSQDGPMLACAALAAALLLRNLRDDPPPFRFWLPLFCVLLAAIIAARPPYLPLALLPLRLHRLGWRARRTVCAVVLAAGLGWTVLAGWAAGLDTAANHGGDILAQLRGLALHPWRVMFLARQTFLEHGVFYRDSFIGCLGWLDVALPGAYLTAAAIMLAVAVPASLCAPQRVRLADAGFVVLWVIAAVALVFLAEYLTWTKLGALSVDGVQGRYFLPLAVFLLPVAATLPPVGRAARPAELAVLAFPVVTTLVVLRALLIRYYLS